jgi:predicted MPP superfamily phosphohydrolase
MSNIKVNEYILKDPKFNKDRTVVNMSDIHSNVVALNNIVKLLEEIKASYIYVPGDTLDSIDNQHNKEIMELLKKVGNISQTFLSVGNHEMCELSYSTGKKEEVESKGYIDFFFDVAKNTNCIPMISDFSKINLADDLSVSAVNVPFSYYEKREDLEQYKKLLENVKEKIDENKFNILLLHSPNSLIQNGKIDKSSDVIRNMNLILCGHNHGGLMPTFAQDILKGHRGLAGPYAKLLQPNAYGVYNEEDTSVLVSNGVTKISATSEAGKINGILNKIYTPEIDVIHMVQSDEHSLKLENRSVHKF